MALANRWVTNRQLGFLLGFMGTRVLGQYDLALLSAEAAPGRLLFVEENIRATARALACRSGRSGPGSPCTRRPTPSSSRRIPGCGRTWPSGSSASSGCSRRDARGLGREALRGLGRALRGESRRRALDGAADGAGAAPPVPRDPGGDEPARGLQRLRHGRGRARPGPRRRADPRPVPRASRPAGRRSSGRCSG